VDVVLTGGAEITTDVECGTVTVVPHHRGQDGVAVHARAEEGGLPVQPRHRRLRLGTGLPRRGDRATGDVVVRLSDLRAEGGGDGGALPTHRGGQPLLVHGDHLVVTAAPLR